MANRQPFLISSFQTEQQAYPTSARQHLQLLECLGLSGTRMLHPRPYSVLTLTIHEAWRGEGKEEI